MLRVGKSAARPRVRSLLLGLAACGAASVGSLLAIAPQPAHAQFFFGQSSWVMPPREIRRSLAQQGYRLLAPPYYSGSVYVADVINGDGVQQRLFVDPYQGSIQQSYNVGPARPRYRAANEVPWPRRYGQDPGYPTADNNGSWFGDPRPPVRIPDSRSAAPLEYPSNGDQVARGPDGTEPLVIPGIGPERLPLRTKQVRRKAPPKTIARTTAPPRPESPAVAPSNAVPPAAAAAAPPPETSKAAPVAPAAPTPGPVAAAPPTPAPAAPPPPPKPAKKAPLNDIPPAPLD